MTKFKDDRFGRLALTLRERAGLTQSYGAAQLGISERSIQFWESGAAFPTPENLKRLIALYLQHGAFSAGHERAEALAFWEQCAASASRRKAFFDAAWFDDLLLQRLAATAHGQPAGVAPASARPATADWGGAPGSTAFFGREAELATLDQWVRADRCQVISLLGMGGVGKTTLAVRFARMAANDFDVVFWRSLQNAPPLDELLDECLQPIADAQRMAALRSTSSERRQLMLLDLLAQRRCLLILDNVETLLRAGSLEGSFREGCEAYGPFIRRLAEAPHQSCVLLTSRELLRELEPLEGPRAVVRTMRLSGLSPQASRALLEDSAMHGSAPAWETFLTHYRSNPLALKLAAATARDLFGGDLDAFQRIAGLPVHSLLQLLDDQFERVSQIEQDILIWMAVERTPVTLDALGSDLGPSVRSHDLLLALKSLRRRSLIERLDPEAMFTLQPVVMEFLSERLVARLSDEILTARPSLLTRYALLNIQSPDYIRESQQRMLVQPIRDRLLAHFGDARWLENQLTRLVGIVRGLSPAAQGYAGGNLVNLLVSLRGHLHGADLSGLVLRQAFLQGVAAQGADFSFADVRETRFMTPLETIASMVMSADGRYLAIGSFSGQVQVWDLAGGTLLWAHKGHSRMAWALAFDAAGTVLASGGYQGHVRLWEVQSGRQTAAWQAHGAWVRTIAFSPSGAQLVTAGDDSSARVWDVRTGERLHTLQGHRGIVWSAAFSPDGLRIISGGGEGAIYVWDAQHYGVLSRIEEHTTIFAVAIHPHGLMFASGSEDGQISLWSLENGQRLERLQRRAQGLATLAFNPAGTLLACGSHDGVIELWATDSSGTAGYVGLLEGHQWLVTSLSFAARDLLASVAYGGQVKIWDVQRGKLLKTLQGHSRLITALAFSPDGSLLVHGEDNGILRVWDTASGRCLYTIQGHRGPVWTIAWSDRGDTFASGGDDREVKLWEPQRGQCRKRFTGHMVVLWTLAFSPDGAMLASGGGDKIIRLYDLRASGSAEPTATLGGSTSDITSIAFRADGHMLASGHQNGEVQLWDVADRQQLLVQQHGTSPVGAVCFTADGQHQSSSNDRIFRRWDTASGACRTTVEGGAAGNWLKAFAFDKCGGLLATGSDDTTVRLWRVTPAGDAVQDPPRIGHSAQVWAVALSDDSRLMASADDQGTILLWDVTAGDVLRRLTMARPYERMNLYGISGLSEAQRTALEALGAVDE